MKKIIFFKLNNFFNFYSIFFYLYFNYKLSNIWATKILENCTQKNYQNVRENKEKIIQIKNKNKINQNYLSIFDESYKKLKLLRRI